MTKEYNWDYIMKELKHCFYLRFPELFHLNLPSLDEFVDEEYSRNVNILPIETIIDKYFERELNNARFFLGKVLSKKNKNRFFTADMEKVNTFLKSLDYGNIRCKLVLSKNGIIRLDFDQLIPLARRDFSYDLFIRNLNRLNLETDTIEIQTMFVDYWILDDNMKNQLSDWLLYNVKFKVKEINNNIEIVKNKFIEIIKDSPELYKKEAAKI